MGILNITCFSQHSLGFIKDLPTGSFIISFSSFEDPYTAFVFEHTYGIKYDYAKSSNINIINTIVSATIENQYNQHNHEISFAFNHGNSNIQYVLNIQEWFNKEINFEQLISLLNRKLKDGLNFRLELKFIKKYKKVIKTKGPQAIELNLPLIYKYAFLLNELNFKDIDFSLYREFYFYNRRNVVAFFKKESRKYAHKDNSLALKSAINEFKDLIKQLAECKYAIMNNNNADLNFNTALRLTYRIKELRNQFPEHFAVLKYSQYFKYKIILYPIIIDYFCKKFFNKRVSKRKRKKKSKDM